MNMIDFLDRQVPDYYPSMYLDGYTPDQIYASYRKMLREMYSQEEPAQNISFSYEVKGK